MENQHLDVVNWFVAELFQAGVKHVCISPGSRSTPLTMAIARQGDMRLWTLMDERSAGFFALGIARGTRNPVALVCTSGTATANYLPAVMEAFQARVPLIVLTADRPAELRGIGSNQTVDQVKLYAGHVKWQVEMPVPDESTDLVSHARMTAWRAFSAAMTLPCGPVHINLPFREPLVPPYRDAFHEADESFSRSLHVGILTPSQDAIAYANELLADSKRPLVICGPLLDEEVAQSVVRLSVHIDAPLFADILSYVRTCTDGARDANVIDTYDVWLSHSHNLSWPSPDLIVRFGAAPTSKALGLYLKEHRHVRQMVIDTSPFWRDASMSATDVFQCDEKLFCKGILSASRCWKRPIWQSFWHQVNETAKDALQAGLMEEDWHEPGIVNHLRALLPEISSEGVQVFCGNSMPVRDFETFFGKGPESISFLANRGVSGIDGVVSTALGLVAGNGKPTVLVIGDVSFYHDLNGLFAAKQFQLPLLVVLVNNNGGGIFSFLPQSAYSETFSHFQTPHGIDFGPIVQAYDGMFRKAVTWEMFQSAVREGFRSKKLFVIEIATNVEDNVAWHRAIHQRVADVLEEVEWKVDLYTSAE